MKFQPTMLPIPNIFGKSPKTLMTNADLIKTRLKFEPNNLPTSKKLCNLHGMYSNIEY